VTVNDVGELGGRTCRRDHPVAGLECRFHDRSTETA